MRSILLFIVFISCQYLIAQDSSWTVKAIFQPFALINLDKPYVQGGIDVSYQEKIHAELIYGRRYINDFPPIGKNYRPYHTPYRGQTISTSLYFSISKDKQWKIGFNYRFNSDRMNRSILYFDSLGIGPDIEDVFAIERKVHVLNLRVYYEEKINDQFSVAFLIEAGIRDKRRSIDGEDFEFNPTSGSYRRKEMMFGQDHNEFQIRLPHVMPSVFLVYKIL